MKFNNNELFYLATTLDKEFANLNIYIPAKANFFLQKNLTTIINAAQEIEKTRTEILQHYGSINEETNQYDIPEDKYDEVNKELIDLFSIEQELDIKTFKIEDLGNAEFSTTQMQAIMFMIEEG